jgi:hypothetical protein
MDYRRGRRRSWSFTYFKKEIIMSIAGVGTPLSLLTSPSSAMGASLPSVSTPISSAATSDLNSAGSYYNVTSGQGGINFGPSSLNIGLIAGALLLGLLIWKRA